MLKETLCLRIQWWKCFQEFRLRVPIQFRSNAGTSSDIVDYATSDTVENELLRSFRDIDLILNGQMISR